MTGRLSVDVPDGAAGGRVDRFVADASGLSRAYVQRLIGEGRLTHEGRPLKANAVLQRGMTLELDVPEVAPLEVAAERIPLRIAYEDGDVLIVDKPAGLVTHPAPGHPTGTLVNALLGLEAEADAGPREFGGIAGVARPGIVHRLDRDTSGLMVVARTPRAYDALVAALAARDVERRYQALAWGRFESRRGTVDAPVGRSATRRTRMAVRESGREARTSYEVLRQYDDPVVALVACTLETGRTHQIRVHLAHIGHPVLGDRVYGGTGELSRELGLGRPFLHAYMLAFPSETGERVTVEGSLPDELLAALEAARLRPPGPPA